MKKTKDLYQVSLKVILRNNKNEILALKAVASGSYAGFYDFPGGRINNDEFNVPFMEIASREVIEEVGAVKFKINPVPIAAGRHLIPAKLTSSGLDIKVLYLFFVGQYLGGEITISQEHTGFIWLDLSKIKLEKYFKSGDLEGIKMYYKNYYGQANRSRIKGPDTAQAV